MGRGEFRDSGGEVLVAIGNKGRGRVDVKPLELLKELLLRRSSSSGQCQRTKELDEWVCEQYVRADKSVLQE